MWKFPYSSCATKCAMINQNAELEKCTFLRLFSSHFSTTADSEISAHSSVHSLRFYYFCLVHFYTFLLPARCYSMCMEATCSPELHSVVNLVLRSGIKKQTKKRKKNWCIKMRLLIVNISAIFHLPNRCSLNVNFFLLSLCLIDLRKKSTNEIPQRRFLNKLDFGEIKTWI